MTDLFRWDGIIFKLFWFLTRQVLPGPTTEQEYVCLTHASNQSYLKLWNISLFIVPALLRQENELKFLPQCILARIQSSGKLPRHTSVLQTTKLLCSFWLIVVSCHWSYLPDKPTDQSFIIICSESAVCGADLYIMKSLGHFIKN